MTVEIKDIGNKVVVNVDGIPCEGIITAVYCKPNYDVEVQYLGLDGETIIRKVLRGEDELEKEK